MVRTPIVHLVPHFGFAVEEYLCFRLGVLDFRFFGPDLGEGDLRFPELFLGAIVDDFCSDCLL